MNLEHPWLLLLIIPFAAVITLAWIRKGPTLTIPSVHSFRKAVGIRRFFWKKDVPLILYGLAGLLIIFALAGPRKGIEKIRTSADGIDIMLAVDLSSSMESFDVPRNGSVSQIQAGLLKSRMDIAKKEISLFVKERPNDRIGLVVFASQAFTVCPPTLDHAFLLKNLERLETRMIGDGTGIAPPIASAVSRMKDSKAKSRIIVLFTDGQNTVNSEISPVDAGKLADALGITIYTVGIGTPRAVFWNGFGFQENSGHFDEPLLRELASMTGGRYYHAADAKGMANAMQQINSLERTSAEQSVTILWKEWYPELCCAAIAAMLLGLILQHTILLRLP